MLSVDPKARLITVTETLVIQDITKTKFNNCFIIHCIFITLSTNNDLLHKTTFGSLK